jgi:hypothetical protein
MKEIVLKPVEIYENHMLIDVFDYTYPIYETKGALNPSRGVNKSELPLMPRPKAGYGDPTKKGKPKLRKRMTIDVDYSAYDISGLRISAPPSTMPSSTTKSTSTSWCGSASWTTGTPSPALMRPCTPLEKRSQNITKTREVCP